MSDLYKVVYASKDYVESVVESKANTSDLASHINDASNPHKVTLSQLGVTATSDELNYIDGVTSNVQTQLDGLSGLVGDSAVSDQISEAMTTAVLHTEQTLTDEQKLTAQINIGLEEATEGEIYALMLEEGAMPVVQAEDGSVLCIAENEMLLI